MNEVIIYLRTYLEETDFNGAAKAVKSKGIKQVFWVVVLLLAFVFGAYESTKVIREYQSEQNVQTRFELHSLSSFPTIRTYIGKQPLTSHDLAIFYHINETRAKYFSPLCKPEYAELALTFFEILETMGNSTQRNSLIKIALGILEDIQCFFNSTNTSYYDIMMNITDDLAEQITAFYIPKRHSLGKINITFRREFTSKGPSYVITDDSLQLMDTSGELVIEMPCFLYSFILFGYEAIKQSEDRNDGFIKMTSFHCATETTLSISESKIQYMDKFCSRDSSYASLGCLGKCLYNSPMTYANSCIPFKGKGDTENHFCSVYNHERFDDALYDKCEKFCDTCLQCRSCESFAVTSISVQEKAKASPTATLKINIANPSRVSTFVQYEKYTWTSVCAVIGGIMGFACGVHLVCISHFWIYFFVVPFQHLQSRRFSKTGGKTLSINYGLEHVDNRTDETKTPEARKPDFRHNGLHATALDYAENTDIHGIIAFAKFHGFVRISWFLAYVAVMAFGLAEGYTIFFDYRSDNNYVTTTSLEPYVGFPPLRFFMLNARNSLDPTRFSESCNPKCLTDERILKGMSQIKSMKLCKTGSKRDHNLNVEKIEIADCGNASRNATSYIEFFKQIIVDNSGSFEFYYRSKSLPTNNIHIKMHQEITPLGLSYSIPNLTTTNFHSKTMIGGYISCEAHEQGFFLVSDDATRMSTTVADASSGAVYYRCNEQMSIFLTPQRQMLAPAFCSEDEAYKNLGCEGVCLYQNHVTSKDRCIPFMGLGNTANSFCMPWNNHLCDTELYASCTEWCASCRNCKPCVKDVMDISITGRREIIGKTKLSIKLRDPQRMATYTQKAKNTGDWVFNTVAGLMSLCFGLTIVSFVDALKFLFTIIGVTLKWACEFK